MKKTNRGFTLIEVSVALAIMAMLAVIAVPRLMEEVNEKRANITIQETQMIVDAAREYRSINGAWPGNATCLDAITVLRNTTPPMLSLPSATNKYNSAITTSCTAFTFSVDQSAVQGWDGFLASSIPGTSVVNPANFRIRTTIGIPGSEPALDAKLSRIATGNAELNRMRTSLLLGNNDISEVKDISAVNLSATGNVSTSTLNTSSTAIINGALAAKSVSQFDKAATFNDDIVLGKVVTLSSACTPNGAVARDSTGRILSCQSGVWSFNQATVPAGTLCGLESAILGVYAKCQGHSPKTSCPTGYTKVLFSEGNKGGIQNIHYCAKS